MLTHALALISFWQYIDANVNDPIQRIETGIRFSDGDGTVPLLSLGYMCSPSGPWTKHADLYNPGHSPVVLREYMNEVSVSKLDVRGGYKASDHVDILGNWEMTVSISLAETTMCYSSTAFSWICYRLCLERGTISLRE